MFLKQSTAVTVKVGPFVDSTDGNTQETALTISQADIRLSKNGGAFAQTNNVAGATHDANGWYGVPLDTTDTNTLGTLELSIHETGALAVWRTFMVVPANVWDSLFGADKLQVHADEITAGLITAAAIATGAIDADAIAADAITAAKVAADVHAEAADAVWDEARAGHVAAGSFGEGVASVQGNVTGSAASVTGAVGSVTGNVGGNVAGSVASVTAGVTVTTNNDKTGYALSAAGVDAVWDEALAGHTTAGTAGKAVSDIETDVTAILADTGTDGVVVAAASKTGYELSATGSAALTEGYATDGSAATLPQLLYMIWSMLAEKSVASTTLTTKKLDGSTSAMTFTLNSATDPTSITRAT